MKKYWTPYFRAFYWKSVKCLLNKKTTKDKNDNIFKRYISGDVTRNLFFSLDFQALRSHNFVEQPLLSNRGRRLVLCHT